MKNILIYTQYGNMGGSLRLILNVAKALATVHHVTIVAPALVIQKEGDWNIPHLHLYKQEDFILSSTPDLLLLHLPFGTDAFLDVPAQKKILVIMEIMSLHPLKLSARDVQKVNAVITLHEDQTEAIQAIAPEVIVKRLEILNDISIDLPYKKTNIIASIGAASYKHNVRNIIIMLFKSKGYSHYAVYTQEPQMLLKQGWKSRILLRYYLLVNKLNLHPVEWDINKLYSSFDILLHTPSSGNGTSMVVSDALSCGKAVVLSSLEAYKKAYGHLKGVYFIEDLKGDLSSVMQSWNKKMSHDIKENYKQVYNRNKIQQDWINFITS